MPPDRVRVDDQRDTIDHRPIDPCACDATMHLPAARARTHAAASSSIPTGAASATVQCVATIPVLPANRRIFFVFFLR